MASVPESNGKVAPKITLYTNYACGWSHGIHIILCELGLSYEEVSVDLMAPRPEWFLKLNPRGVVPVIQYTAPGQSEPITLIESALITKFLTTLHPSHLTAPTLASRPSAPLSAFECAVHAYHAGLVTDAFFNKANPMMAKFRAAAADPAAQDKVVDELVRVVETEIEPVLARVGTTPWFGGADKPGLAEALITPFSMRFYLFANDRIIPSSLARRWDALPVFSEWAHRCMALPGVRANWDPDPMIAAVEKHMAAARPR